MKKFIKLSVILFINIFILSGCSYGDGGKASSLRSPLNGDLEVMGNWKVEEHKVLEGNIISEEEKNSIIGNVISFQEEDMIVGNEEYEKIKYQLKIVDNNYTISYEDNYKIAEIFPNHNKSRVYSIHYQNKIFAEIYFNTLQESYFYFKGVIFKISQTNDENIIQGNKIQSSSESEEKISSEGLYISLVRDDVTEDSYEKYRTLWISTKEGNLQPIKERDNIIVPRVKDIWSIEPKVYEDKDKNIYYEYFTSTPIESKNLEEGPSKGKTINYNVLENTYLRRKINFVGNNYVATEVYTNNSSYNSNYFEMLPVDNLNSAKGISIQDLYRDNVTKKVYQEAYNNTISKLELSNNMKVSKDVDYYNYSLVRDSGKWLLKGRVSSLNSKDYLDFTTSIKAVSTLINYDTLNIPWKMLKGSNPKMVDAYTSPNKSLAIIVLENEILIYKVSMGALVGEPIRRIPLYENERVIMAEWCSSSYIDRWGNVFKENSRTIE